MRLQCACSRAERLLPLGAELGSVRPWLLLLHHAKAGASIHLIGRRLDTL